jgi:hypothetical protein
VKRPEKKSLEELRRLYLGKSLTKKAELDIENSGCYFCIYISGEICSIKKSQRAIMMESQQEA